MSGHGKRLSKNTLGKVYTLINLDQNSWSHVDLTHFWFSLTEKLVKKIGFDSDSVSVWHSFGVSLTPTPGHADPNMGQAHWDPESGGSSLTRSLFLYIVVLQYWSVSSTAIRTFWNAYHTRLSNKQWINLYSVDILTSVWQHISRACPVMGGDRSNS